MGESSTRAMGADGRVEGVRLGTREGCMGDVGILDALVRHPTCIIINYYHN